MLLSFTRHLLLNPLKYGGGGYKKVININNDAFSMPLELYVIKKKGFRGLDESAKVKSQPLLTLSLGKRGKRGPVRDLFNGHYKQVSLVLLM